MTFIRYESIIYALGIFAALYILISVIHHLIRQTRLYIFPLIFTQPNLSVKYGGKWAIITGGSDGIGKGYSLELAKRGMNICILSNFENDIVALVEQHKVKCKYINVDFSSTDVYEGIKKDITDILDDVGILINNVGTVDQNVKGVVNENNTYFAKIININISTMVFMTDLVLKTFVKRNKGLILNMGSISSAWPLPYATMYSSTKSFIEIYTVCLAAELRKTNVEVKCIKPFFIRTKLVTNISKAGDFLRRYFSCFFPPPSRFSASVIRTLGRRTPTVYAGYWIHTLIAYVASLHPLNLSTQTAFMGWCAEKVLGYE